MDLTAALTGHFASVTPLKPSTGTPLTYDDRVDSVPALFHWPLRESSGTTFAQRLAAGVHPATGSGELEYIDGTLVQDDASGRCLGMGSGADTSVITIASHTAFDVTAGAWFAVIQPDTLAKMQIITRWPNAATEAGFWSFEMQSGGSLSAVRRAGDTPPSATATSPPVMTAGMPSLVGFSWGNEGLRVWYGATVVGAEEAPTTTWAGAPNVPIRVGRWVTGVDGFDGLIAHLVFLNFEPTNADVAHLVAMGPGLSLLTGATLASIEVGQSNVYSIRPYGHFTETITSVNEVDADPPNINVTVSGEDFTVQGVALDAGETFRLSVTDGRGTTAPATFTVPVTAASGTETWRYVDGVDWDFDAGGSVAARTTIFQDIIATASAGPKEPGTNRGVIELIPGKTYVLRTTPGTNANPNACLTIDNTLPNVEIRTQGKPIVGGNQAKLQFESWAGKSGVCRMSILHLRSSSNVKIGWLELDGNKASCASTYSARVTWLDNNINYAQGGNGAISNIRVAGGSGITVEQVECYNALTDGITVVSSTGSGGVPTQNFLAVDCYCHHNRRMEFGISSGPTGNPALTWDQVVFRRCTGRFCGDEAGVMPGQRPGAAVDIEPLHPGEDVYGLTFDQCVWRDSAGTTFDSDLGGPVGYAGGRGLASDSHGHCVYFKMIDCQAIDNTAEAVQFNLREGADLNHAEFTNLVATGNANNRLAFAIAQGTGESQVIDTEVVNCNVSEIFFSALLKATGNSVTIWKGNFNPTITTNGKTTITINNGFPP